MIRSFATGFVDGFPKDAGAWGRVAAGTTFLFTGAYLMDLTTAQFSGVMLFIAAANAFRGEDSERE